MGKASRICKPGSSYIESNDKSYQYCYLDLLFSNKRISKILVEVQLKSGYSDASYVGIFATCGEEFLERFGLGLGKTILFSEGETATPFYRESTELPSEIRVLVLSWDPSIRFLSAYLYDATERLLLGSTQVPCAQFPSKVGVGVFTFQGFSIEAVINRVVVWTASD